MENVIFRINEVKVSEKEFKEKALNYSKVSVKVLAGNFELFVSSDENFKTVGRSF